MCVFRFEVGQCVCTQKDGYRIHSQELKRQLVENTQRNIKLTSLAEESRALKDEAE